MLQVGFRWSRVSRAGGHFRRAFGAGRSGAGGRNVSHRFEHKVSDLLLKHAFGLIRNSRHPFWASVTFCLCVCPFSGSVTVSVWVRGLAGFCLGACRGWAGVGGAGARG